MDGDEEALLAAQEGFEKFAASVTGCKAQLVGMGWSERHAEELVIFALRSGAS